MIRRSVTWAGVLCGLIGVWGALTLGVKADDEDRPEAKKKTFASVGMRIKLDMAREILTGLTTDDFELVEKNARAMQGLNELEKFARSKTPGYETQLRIFRYATEELIEGAKEKNLDRSTLAYTQMTINCVNCHKQIRKP